MHPLVMGLSMKLRIKNGIKNNVYDHGLVRASGCLSPPRNSAALTALLALP